MFLHTLWSVSSLVSSLIKVGFDGTLEASSDFGSAMEHFPQIGQQQTNAATSTKKRSGALRLWPGPFFIHRLGRRSMRSGPRPSQSERRGPEFFRFLRIHLNLAPSLMCRRRGVKATPTSSTLSLD